MILKAGPYTITVRDDGKYEIRAKAHEGYEPWFMVDKGCLVSELVDRILELERTVNSSS